MSAFDKLRDAVATNLGDLANAEAYVAETAYAVGDVVTTASGVKGLWICKIAGAGNTPGADTTHWWQIAGPYIADT